MVDRFSGIFSVLAPRDLNRLAYIIDKYPDDGLSEEYGEDWELRALSTQDILNVVERYKRSIAEPPSTNAQFTLQGDSFSADARQELIDFVQNSARELGIHPDRVTLIVSDDKDASSGITIGEDGGYYVNIIVPTRKTGNFKKQAELKPAGNWKMAVFGAISEDQREAISNWITVISSLVGIHPDRFKVYITEQQEPFQIIPHFDGGEYWVQINVPQGINLDQEQAAIMKGLETTLEWNALKGVILHELGHAAQGHIMLDKLLEKKLGVAPDIFELGR